jgi:hypothetical protein
VGVAKIEEIYENRNIWFRFQLKYRPDALKRKEMKGCEEKILRRI